MSTNNSPWLKQLARTRPIARTESINDTDFVIVGGGIAGVTTAYYLLLNTDKNICLLEGDKIAHGATGHNAGQLVLDFERPLSDLVKQFGFDLVMSSIRHLEHSWVLVEEILETIQKDVPMSTFFQSVGYTTYDQLIISLEESFLRKQANLHSYEVFVKKDIAFKEEDFEKYNSFINFVDDEVVLELLESKDNKYIAVSQTKAGCGNSALLTEKIIEYLLENYSERFVLAENTPVQEVVLFDNNSIIKIPQGELKSQKVILCTNGFENITLTNKVGGDIDTKFHHNVEGYVGYMAAYTDSLGRNPTALTYYNTQSTNPDDPYFYLTRRPYDLEKNNPKSNLVSVGGPGIWLPDSTHYQKTNPYPEEIEKSIREFINQTYIHAPQDTEYLFMWHGLMGFTKDYLRLIGYEPCNKTLLYNLGCNGVGLLTSIYGGYRISKILSGQKVEASIFDPKDNLCKI